jgi:hypothetical protein
MIHVIDGFYIVVDAYQYIAQEDSGAKLSSKGKEYTKWNVLGYFTSLDKALDRIILELCNRKTKKKTYELVDYIKEYKSESSKIRKMIKQSMKEVEDNK